jgi:signal transduction histidine kinase
MAVYVRANNSDEIVHRDIDAPDSVSTRGADARREWFDELVTIATASADTQEAVRLLAERFSELVATAIANAESRSELAASRRRIVAVADEARHRIERNLHDGTQQRLASLALAVRAAEADVPHDWHNIRSELSQIATGLTDAVVELQEITRGGRPASLDLT